MGHRAQARIKGGIVREVVLWYADELGEDRLRGRALALPPEHAAALDLDAPGLGLLPNVWYDARIVHALLDSLVEGHGEDETHRLARDAAHAGVRRAARGLYRFVIEQMVSPAFYARHIQSLWRMVHDTGEREIVIADEGGHAVSRTWRWAGHHPVLCLVTIETMAALFEMMTKREVRAERVACVAWGDDECRAELCWR